LEKYYNFSGNLFQYIFGFGDTDPSFTIKELL